MERSSWIRDKKRINYLLREGIKELKNVDRVLSARQLEIYHYLDEFERLGFWWQAKRLRNQIHLAIKQGRFTARSADSLSKREEVSS